MVVKGGLVPDRPSPTGSYHAATTATTPEAPGAPPMTTGQDGADRHGTSPIDRLLAPTSWDRSDLDLAASMLVAAGIALDAVLTFALLIRA